MKPSTKKEIKHLAAERIRELKAQLTHYKTKDTEAQATIVRQQKELEKFKVEWDKRFSTFDKKQKEVVHKQRDEITQLKAVLKDYTNANRKIQFLEARLEDAREGNRNLSALLGKAQKRASKACAVKLKNQNKHLQEQLKKATRRYKELKDGNN